MKLDRLNVVRKLATLLGVSDAGVLENPTEEIVSDLNGGRSAKLFGMAKKKVKLVRKEENFLYSTRRFPALASNTIGAGAVAAGEYSFFNNGIGDAGSTMGYYSLANLTALQTNMDQGGKIPTGKGFALYELAVSFNASAGAADISQCLDTMALSYEKQGGQLRIQHGPIRQWPGGTGLSGFAATTATTTTIQGASNGLATPSAVRRFKAPRVLNANDTFKYAITASSVLPKTNAAVALGDFVEICVWLFGYHYDRIPQ